MPFLVGQAGVGRCQGQSAIRIMVVVPERAESPEPQPPAGAVLLPAFRAEAGGIPGS
jgi:hypothetical protein